MVQQELLRSGESGHFRFEAWPGSYRLRRSLTFYTADAGGWRKPAGGRDIGEPVEVEVLAGHSVQAELEPVP